MGPRSWLWFSISWGRGRKLSVLRLIIGFIYGQQQAPFFSPMSTFRFASRGLIPYCLKLSTPLKISRLNWHIGRKRKPGKSTGSKEIFLGGCVHSKVAMCVHLIIASSCYSSPCMPWFWCRKKEALEADLWLKGTSGSQSPVSRWRSNTTRGGNGRTGQKNIELEEGGGIEEGWRVWRWG